MFELAADDATTIYILTGCFIWFCFYRIVSGIDRRSRDDEPNA